MTFDNKCLNPEIMEHIALYRKLFAHLTFEVFRWLSLERTYSTEQYKKHNLIVSSAIIAQSISASSMTPSKIQRFDGLECMNKKGREINI